MWLFITIAQQKWAKFKDPFTLHSITHFARLSVCVCPRFGDAESPHFCRFRFTPSDGDVAKDDEHDDGATTPRRVARVNEAQTCVRSVRSTHALFVHYYTKFDLCSRRVRRGKFIAVRRGDDADADNVSSRPQCAYECYMKITFSVRRRRRCRR